jgi:sulfate permease, SulP family
MGASVPPAARRGTGCTIGLNVPRRPFPAIPFADVVAGVSVALVVVPQALAYAELAGLPAVHGLAAAAVAPLAAAAFTSSPALQTGPTAMTAVLVLAVLSPLLAPFGADYVGAAALLALLVGVVRLALGLFRAGGLAYAMSGPVLRGFTLGAALLIAASQVPTALGTSADSGRLLVGAWQALAVPSSWSPGALAAAVVAFVALRVGRRLGPRVPTVLIVAAAATAIAHAVPGALGPVVGPFATAWPRLEFALPWHLTPSLILGALVIAVVGFAEPTAIARRYGRPGVRWDPSRELVGQGLANVATGLSAGLPVGASFSRSALHHRLGATTRAGAVVTGLTVLALMPLAGALADLPRAVLAAVVFSAIADLLRLGPVADLWRFGRMQSTTAWGTALLVLAFEPRIDLAIVVGVVASMVLHLAREGRLGVKVEVDGAQGRLRVDGTLWFANVARLEDEAHAAWHGHREVERWVVDLGHVARVDVDAAVALGRLRAEAAEVGVTLEIAGGDARTERRLESYAERPLR